MREKVEKSIWNIIREITRLTKLSKLKWTEQGAGNRVYYCKFHSDSISISETNANEITIYINNRAVYTRKFSPFHPIKTYKIFNLFDTIDRQMDDERYKKHYELIKKDLENVNKNILISKLSGIEKR